MLVLGPSLRVRAYLVGEVLLRVVHTRGLLVLSVEASRLAGWCLSVEDIVLQQEQYIEHDGHRAQPELGEVEEDAHPVVVVEGVQEHLEDGQQATRRVEEDVADAPADGGLAAVVVPGLVGHGLAGWETTVEVFTWGMYLTMVMVSLT